MIFIFGISIFGIPSAIIASYKGFKPMRWLIAFGLIGLVVVSVLSSAKTAHIFEVTANRRAEKANKIGAWMAGLNIDLPILLITIGMLIQLGK